MERRPQGRAARPLRLDLGHPFRRVGKHQRGVLHALACLAQRGEIVRRSARFGQRRGGGGIGAQEACVHLLLRLRELAPAEVADQLRPVRHRLQRPQPHHAGQRGRIVPRPVDRPRLLFEHRPAAALGTAAIEIVVERGDVGVARVGEPHLVRLVETEHLEEPERVAVPPQHVEIGSKVVVVVAGVEPHRVVRHVATRRAFAQHLDLRPVERDHLVAGEPPERQPVRRVRFGHRQARQLDLVEAAVFHAPEHVAPGSVERVDRAVTRCQPHPEGIARSGREALHGVMATVFVVGLPADHARVLSVAFGHCAGDPHRLRAIPRMAEAVVPPRAEPARSSIAIKRDHVRHPVDHPFGRGRGGRAHDDPEPGRMERIHRPVEPAPLEPARFRLDPAPREFADPHPGQPGLAHQPRVFGPALFRPMFGIIAHAQFHAVCVYRGLCEGCQRENGRGVAWVRLALESTLSRSWCSSG